MAFDLAELLKDVPNSGPNREQIEYIDLSLLDNDANNFYALSELDELAANIEVCGLQQPIRVRRSPDAEGRYIIVSGHRRRAALDMLAKDDPEKWREAPCIVELDDVSPNLQQLRLIYANAHTRKLTPAEVSEQAEQVEKLLYKLKEEDGMEFPGRMRDHVAKAVGESKSKLSRLKVIRENLIKVWQPAFKKGDIGESVAYALAKLEPEWQNVMFNAWGDRSRSLYEGNVTSLTKRLEKIGKVDCRAYRGSKCHIQPERQKYIVNLGQYDSWSCNGCCLDCSTLASCKHSCSAASMKKETLIQKQREAKRAEKQAEQDRIAPVLEQIRGIYARWWQALTSKGMSAESYLHACGMRYVGNDAKNFEKHATNPASIKCADTKLPFPTNIWPSDAKYLVAAAEVLGCSIDWLLGRDVPGPGDVPEPGPAAEMYMPWADGEFENPVQPGKYVVLAKWSERGSVGPHIYSWDGSRWLSAGVDVCENGCLILYWAAMPEVP